MSLTRIKDSFAIFKNLVLEARANGSGDNSGDDHASNNGNADHHQQINDLRSCLLQRDTEIAILVNMVKKGKNSTADVVGECKTTSMSHLDNNYGGDISRNDSQGKRNDCSSPLDNFTEEKLAAPKKETSLKNSQSALKEDRENRIIKRHLFGVPPPSDRRIFEDMSGE